MGSKGREGNNPFDMLKNLGDMKDMKKVLGEDFFKSMPFPQWQQAGFEDDGEDDASFPRIDMFERDKEIVTIIEVPGLSGPQDITLAVGPTFLYVKGVVSSMPIRDGKAHVSERFHGPFEREIELPVRVDESTVQASYAQGLLTIRLTKQQTLEGNRDQFIPIKFD